MHAEYPSICEWAPANLVIWKDFDHPRKFTIHQNLCILISPPNEGPYFLEPIGNHKITETVDICLKQAGRISRASEDFIKKLPKERYVIEELREQFDYIYARETLAGLKGKKFDGKRNHIQKFRRHFPDYQFRPLSPADEKDALGLFDKWFDYKKETTYFSKLSHPSQKRLIQNAFLYFEKLELSGGAIYNQGGMLGFILGSQISPEMATVHFMFGNPIYPGIAQILLWEACNKTFSSYKFINLEQDLGIAGLRQAKLSYYPLRLEKKFELSFQKIG